MCILGEQKVKNTVSLKLNREFRKVYGKGRSAVMPAIVVYVLENRLSMNRLGITVSTKIGKAVRRNKIRRRLREAYRINEEKIKTGYDIVLVARGKSRAEEFRGLEAEFLKAAEKLGLLRK